MPANDKVAYFKTYNQLMDAAIRKKQYQENGGDDPGFVAIPFKDKPKHYHGNDRKTQYYSNRYQDLRKGYHRELADIMGI